MIVKKEAKKKKKATKCGGEITHMLLRRLRDVPSPLKGLKMEKNKKHLSARNMEKV